MAGIALDEGDRPVKGYFSVKVLENLLVPDGLERRQSTVTDQTGHFIDKSVIDHLQYPAVDPVIEFSPRTDKTDLLDSEIAVFPGASLER